MLCPRIKMGIHFGRNAACIHVGIQSTNRGRLAQRQIKCDSCKASQNETCRYDFDLPTRFPRVEIKEKPIRADTRQGLA